MSGVTVATMIRSIVGRVDACVGERRARGRRAMSVSASSLVRDPSLADAGALDDPLVVRVDELLEILVRDRTRSGTFSRGR